MFNNKLINSPRGAFPLNSAQNAEWRNGRRGRFRICCRKVCEFESRLRDQVQQQPYKC